QDEDQNESRVQANVAGYLRAVESSRWNQHPADQSHQDGNNHQGSDDFLSGSHGREQGPKQLEREARVESFKDGLEYGAEQDDKAPEYEEMHPPGERLTQQLCLAEGDDQDILQPGADSIETILFPADRKKPNQPSGAIGKKAESRDQNDGEYDTTHIDLHLTIDD